MLNLVDSGEHQQTQELYSEVQGQGIRKSVDGLARQLPCPGPVSLVDAFIPGPSWSTLLTLWVSRPSYEPVRSLVLRCFDYLGDAVMKHLSNIVAVSRSWLLDSDHVCIDSTKALKVHPPISPVLPLDPAWLCGN